MCGRFAQHLTWRQIHELYQLPESARPLHLQPRYNGAPVQDFAVCRLDEDGSRTLATLRWGLVPSWANDLRRGAQLVNARAETLHDKPSFSAAFRARRCLVPANGWFEWQRTGHAKQPYFLALVDGSPLSFAARHSQVNESGTYEGRLIRDQAAVTAVHTVNARARNIR